MPAALDPYKVQTGERSNYAKFDGLVATAQASLNAVGDQTQNQWGTGLILAPSQLSQGGATTGQFLVYNGTQYAPTTVVSKFSVQTTAVNFVNTTATEIDLFTGNAPGATGGLLIPGGTITARCGIRVIASGVLVNGTGGSRGFIFKIRVRDSVGTFFDAWEDATGNVSSANRAFCLELSGQGNAGSPTNGGMSFNGKLEFSDGTAATAGIGAIKASPQLLAFPSGSSGNFNISNSCRVHFTIIPEISSGSLGANLFVGRIEVTA